MATPHRIDLIREETLHYLLELPAGEKPDAGWPLLLFLHGAGERGSDFELLYKHGPLRLVREGRKFPFIIAAPQCPAGNRWRVGSLIRLVDALVAENPVDSRRVYVSGISMGGFGTWDLISEHPERFAAAVPICGGGEFIRAHLQSEEKREALKTLPIWAFHGDADPIVPLSETERMVGLFRHLGNEQIKTTVYPGVGHDSWTETYASGEVFEWLLKHRR